MTARAIIAGVVYTAMVFAAGFLLGTLRVLVVAPMLGEKAAVAVELPIILAISWFASGWTIRRLGVPASITERAVMGAIALALLLSAEAGLALLLMGRTLGEHLASYRTLPVALGLVGQIVFALMPMVRGWQERR